MFLVDIDVLLHAESLFTNSKPSRLLLGFHARETTDFPEIKKIVKLFFPALRLVNVHHLDRFTDDNNREQLALFA